MAQRTGTAIRRRRLSSRGRIGVADVAAIQQRAADASLRLEVQRLENSLRETQERLARLEQESAARRTDSPDEIIILREIGKAEARREIIELFRSGRPLDQADLADALSLELGLVMEICDELLAEGVVAFYADDRS